ncbi:MAG TPA: low temperature requirement protein A [Solirubrobacteraceae bacterium]
MTSAAPEAPVWPERRTAPVELLWDLVFVFAVTQVTTLLAHDLTWGGFGRAMLVLALVWWAWSAFVWAANAADEASTAFRLWLLAAMVLSFVAGLAVPGAFGDEAVVFAVAYAAVRLIHLALYADASRRGNASWEAIAGFALTVLVGMALLVVGALLDEGPRTALWALAAAIDYAGPGWLTRARLRGLQRVAVAHFAERYSLFVIICLGESVVALGVGVGTADRTLTAGLIAGATLALLVAVALWWTYFDRLAAAAEARLRTHPDPVLAAADSYSYLHLPVVAGIIVFAAGAKALVAAVDDPLATAERLALCGGLALYLVALSAFELRLLATVAWPRLAAAAALLVLFAAGGALPAWGVAAVAAALMASLCLGGARGSDGGRLAAPGG